MWPLMAEISNSDRIFCLYFQAANMPPNPMGHSAEINFRFCDNLKNKFAKLLFQPLDF